MGMCFNKRVLIGLGVVALAVFALAPNLLGAAAPLLLLAACPLSMVFMTRGMGGTNNANGSGASCGTKANDADAAGAVTATSIASNGSAATDARLRELEEEVNRLRAEVRLRDGEPSS